MMLRNWMREDGTRNFILKLLKRSDSGISLYFDKLFLQSSRCPVCPISAPTAFIPEDPGPLMMICFVFSHFDQLAWAQQQGLQNPKVLTKMICCC